MTQSPETTASRDATALCARPWAAVWSLLIGFFMLMIDASILSVANPSIQRGLGASLTETIWVTSAYLLGLAVPLLVAGRLGDRFGQRTMFLIGMAVFTLSSLACGLAPSVRILIAARAVQGIGGSLMTPQSQAVIVRIFPPHRRGAAMGLWGSVSGIAMLIGPVLGGFLVQAAGWQSIFLINVPVGVVGLVLAARFVPKLPTSRPKFDWSGVILSGAGILLVVYGLQEGANRAWRRVWGPVTIPEIIVVGVLLLVIFVVNQAKADDPLLPLNLFRDRDFSLANSSIFLVGIAVTSMSLPLLYFVQVARGFDPMLSAVFMMPSAVVGAIIAPMVGARVVAKLGANRVASFGLIVYSGSLFWMTAYFTPSSNIWLALIPSAIMGVGNACMWSPLAMSATHHLPPARAGAGAGVYNTVRQVGSTLGSAIMATLMNATLTAHGVSSAIVMGHQIGVALPPSVSAEFSRAMAQSLYLPCAVALVGAVCAAFLSGQAGRRSEVNQHVVSPSFDSSVVPAREGETA